jgi:glycosyltransferase involved in cell wall biosynthesis
MISSERPWIFLCAFRGEGETLVQYLDEMLDVLASSKALDDASLVMVDDFSLDQSVAVVENWKATHPQLKIEVLSSATNLGTQGALAWGLSQIELLRPETQWVFSMDPDGEDDLTSLPRMMAEAKAKPNSVVYSVRTQRNDSLRMKMLYFPFRWLYCHVTGRKILPNNFMVLPGRYQKAVLHSPFLPVYYALATLRLGLPCVTSPSPRRLRYGGQTTQNVYNLITHALVGLMIFHETVVAKVYSYIAIAGVVLVFTNVFALFVKFVQDKPVPDGYASTYLTMNFGFAVILLALLVFTASISMGLKLASYYLIRWNSLMEETQRHTQRQS